MRLSKVLGVVLLLLSFNILSAQTVTKQQQEKVSLDINTKKGHPVVPGSSGFNVRIGDKVWSYKHPDFIKAVKELKPGWLRYWSGTAGDAFSAATGMYDKEYINMFDKGEAYDRLYQFVEVKGPHRIIDLYHLLGTVNGKLVVTVNAFTETPEMTSELARFCKNNSIKVECWQFCNEPYFYIPGRQRYWWNDGYDYAQKMKPHADAIQKIFPDAKLALNFTWDGIWGFMKEINGYQKEKGAFWNVFSKHSYAPHTGKEESFADAYKRMNTKLIEATDEKAMSEIEQWTQKDIPVLITEFGVWNKPLNGIMSAIYNAEYTLRQLSHSNTWLIGSHEISNKIKPEKNFNKQITDAFENNQPINTTTLQTGIAWDDEGKAMALVHEATNSSNHVWPVNISNGPQVAGLNNKDVTGMFALAFKGLNEFDYLLITNRSSNWQTATMSIDGNFTKLDLYLKWMATDKSNGQNLEIQQEILSNTNIINVPAHSVVLIKWKNNRSILPPVSRIYKAEVKSNGIYLQWWKQAQARSYIITSTNKQTGDIVTREVQKSAIDNFLFTALQKNIPYTFTIQTKNENGISDISEPVTITNRKPAVPVIFKTAPRDNEITVFWSSVPDASGYKVIVTAGIGAYTKEYDADNVFGYKIKDLEFDKAYSISVKAYNGLGQSAASSAVNVTCKRNIPLPATNISAIENKDGSIILKWNRPKQVVSGIKYRLYRGEKLHHFFVLRDSIEATEFIDKTAEKGREYFYTVKSYTADGECSFYPNTATIIRNNKMTNVEVESIVKQIDGYDVKVIYSNIPVDGDTEFSVVISDVSYLNGEEVNFIATSASNGMYIVKIPLSVLKAKAMYSIKASIKTNGGTPVISLPPHKEIKAD